MSIPDILQEALRIVEEAELPEGLQEIAFSKTVDLLARQEGLEAGVPDEEERREEPPRPAAGDLLDRAAQRLDVDPEVLAHVYLEEEGDMVLEVPPNDLAQASDAAAMREIALLYAAGRQAAGLEEWTSRNAIREVTQEYGVYNRSFVNVIDRMRDVFRIRAGEGDDRRIQVRRPGLTRAREIILRIAGHEE